MENEVLTYQKFVDACKQIARKIKMFYPSEFTAIYGIPRGGLSMSLYLSHLLSLPVADCPCKADLICDDISDSGKTLRKYKDKFIVTIYYHKQSDVEPDIWIYEKKDKWIQFPWEVK